MPGVRVPDEPRVQVDAFVGAHLYVHAAHPNVLIAGMDLCFALALGHGEPQPFLHDPQRAV
eukprot:1435544-Prymnesium_polylepis.2